MGADLYIESIQKIKRDWYGKAFEEAVKTRNAHKYPYNEEYQEQVEYLFDKMARVGYFRDSYNDSNLLWRFDLSYWQNDFQLDDNHNLPPSEARRLLTMLKARERLFEASLRPRILIEQGWKDPHEGIRYFRMKYIRLKVFLRMAIKLNETIIWSV